MLDILRFCQAYRIDYAESGHHHCHEGWIQIHCPFCAGGRSGFHLGFHLNKGTFNCWRCGPHQFRDTIKALTHQRTHDSVREIVGRFQKNSHEPKQVERTRPRSLRPPTNAGPLHRAHKKYLQERGFDPDRLQMDWKLLGTEGYSGVWSWRVIVPICNADNATIAYQGRAIGDVKPKYRMTDEDECLEDPRTFLYGIHRAVTDSVIIVEGAPGVWRLGAGAVATLGIDWKMEQANQLRTYKNRYILFDPEPQAQKQAEKLASHLSVFDGSTEIITGFKTDPGDFSPALAARIKRKLGMGG